MSLYAQMIMGKCSVCGIEVSLNTLRTHPCAPPPENPPNTGNRDSDEDRLAVAHWQDRLAKFFPRSKRPTGSEIEMFKAGLRTSRAELLAEVERLQLESDGHRLEAAERKENERCLREEVARLRIAVLAAKKWDEGGDCELPPEGKPRLSEICDEALGAGHREGRDE